LFRLQHNEDGSEKLLGFEQNLHCEEHRPLVVALFRCLRLDDPLDVSSPHTLRLSSESVPRLQVLQRDTHFGPRLLGAPRDDIIFEQG
jgi:hypothetical protein